MPGAVGFKALQPSSGSRSLKESNQPSSNGLNSTKKKNKMSKARKLRKWKKT
jgi:hypothetical protein